MKQMKLKDLYAACKREVENGNGEKYLIAPSDNEGNGYHGVFFLLTPIINGELYDGLLMDSVERNPENCIVVG